MAGGRRSRAARAGGAGAPAGRAHFRTETPQPALRTWEGLAGEALARFNGDWVSVRRSLDRPPPPAPSGATDLHAPLHQASAA